MTCTHNLKIFPVNSVDRCCSPTCGGSPQILIIHNPLDIRQRWQLNAAQVVLAITIDPVIDRFLENVRLTLQDYRPNHPKDNQENDGLVGESADRVIEILHRVIL